jgi:hypothetical protein
VDRVDTVALGPFQRLRAGVIADDHDDTPAYFTGLASVNYRLKVAPAAGRENADI